MKVTATSTAGMPVVLQIDKLPDECPACHQGIDVGQLAWYVITDDSNRVRATLRCPRQNCREIFVGYYYRYQANPLWTLVGLLPSSPKAVSVPDEVAKISPTYVLIRKQVAKAEAEKLEQLVGMGLRKALEFLVKDFAISEHKNDAENIKKMLLGPCIEKYLPDGNIKVCAKRATWLGNDETHYLRKWEDKDVNDLKELIRLTVNWIDSHLATQRFVGDMPEGKK
jgi:hypothetical protein